MSKIVQVRASAQLAALGRFVPGLGTNTRRDRAVARIIGDEGRVGLGRSASRAEPSTFYPSVLDRHAAIAGR